MSVSGQKVVYTQPQVLGYLQASPTMHSLLQSQVLCHAVA